MFKISNKVRRLTNEEKDRYLKDGYLTGLPVFDDEAKHDLNCLLYTSPSPRDRYGSRMPSSA